MEVEQAAASDSASQDSDSRAAREAKGGQVSSGRKKPAARITPPENTGRVSIPSRLRQNRTDGVDLNETSEHPYPPVQPPPVNPLNHGIDPTSNTPETRALLRAAEDKVKDRHLELIGAAIFGTDDVTSPTARLETFSG